MINGQYIRPGSVGNDSKEKKKRILKVVKHVHLQSVCVFFLFYGSLYVTMTVGWAEAEKKRIPSNKGTRCGEGDRWKKKKKKRTTTLREP